MAHPKAFTLLELMLIVGIVSFITVSSLTGFLVSSERLKFQNEVQNLQSTISTQKAQGLNNTDENTVYSLDIDQEKIILNQTNTSTQQVDSNLYKINTEEITLSNFNAKQTTSSWQTITSPEINITINTENRTCSITNTSTQEEYLILHIPISRPTETTPSKHLYIHRENCLIESLNNQIQT